MEQENEVKAPLGLKVLSFLIPLVGLILFCVNFSEKPKYAKGCGIAALIGFITGIILAILIPIILGIAIFNGATSALEAIDTESIRSELHSERINAFNSKFESYKGKEVSGTMIRSLILMVKNHNAIYDENEVTIRVDGVRVNQAGSNVTISPSETYKVEMLYNREGYIYQINVTSNE